MSFKVEMVMPDEERVSNALRFATHGEADKYGYDLLCRWYAPIMYNVVETDDPVTHRWDEVLNDALPKEASREGGSAVLERDIQF